MKLAEIVAKSGMSRRKLASLCGCSAGTICNVINGQRPSGWNQIKKHLRAALEPHATKQQLARALGGTRPRAHGKGPGTVREDDMALARQTLTPKARRHFNFPRLPLADPETPDDVYIAPDEASIRLRQALYDAAHIGGFVAVIGDPGAGKTTLLSEMAARQSTNANPAKIIAPHVLTLSESEKFGKPLRGRDIAEAILSTLAPGAKIPSSNESLSRQVKDVLVEAASDDKRPLLVLEEAHDLHTQTIMMLKRFYDLQHPEKMGRLLSIIMLGHKKLADRLELVPEAWQRCEIHRYDPLANPSEYLTFRFSRAGLNILDYFEPDALAEIQTKLIAARDERGHGVNRAYPLAVNNLTIAALNHAAEFGEPKVTAELVRETRAA